MKKILSLFLISILLANISCQTPSEEQQKVAGEDALGFINGMGVVQG